MADKERELYLQAQRRLVASLVYDGASATRVFELVSPEDVDEPSLELIISSVMELARRDSEISVISIGKELEKDGLLSQIGGISELNTLRTEGERYRLEAPAELYAGIVRESSAKSKLKNLLDDSKDVFQDDSGISAVDAISNLQSELSNTLYGLSDDSTVVNVSNYMDSYFDVLEERLRISKENEDKADGLQGIPSLVPTLNKYTSGWQSQQLITIGARTGVGKTVFAIMSAVAAARAGKSVLFFSLEMPHSEIIDRIVACMSGVSITKLKQGKVTDEEKGYIQKAQEEFKELKITVDTDPKATVDSIRAKAFKAAQSPTGLDIIILDYLQLITPSGKYSNRQEAVSDMSRNMKLTAKALDIPIMVLVQLNRAKGDEEDDKLPTLDNIRESGAIAMDSDIVILLHRDVTQDDTTPPTLVILEKNRNGESNKIIRCHSNLECSLFREIKREKETSERLTEEEMEDLEDDIDLSDFEDLDDDIDLDDL